MTETETQYTVLVEVLPSRTEPCCLLQLVGLRRNGTKRQLFRDMPIHGRFTDIQVDQQRYHCKECDTTVYERVPNVDTAHRMTERMVQHIARAAVKRTFSDVGREVGLDEKTVRNVFRAYVDERLKAMDSVTPKVLGIDEKFLLGKPRAVIGNVKEKTLLDILPTRFRADIGGWLERLPDRDGIEVVCQDMYHEYRAIARKYLPKAVMVVDKFHVIMKANLAVEMFRRKLNSSMPAADR